MSSFPYWKLFLPDFREMYRDLVEETPPVARDHLGNLVMTRQYPKDHHRVDAISNHFTEEVRIDASFNGHPTPRESYRRLCGYSGYDVAASAFGALSPEEQRDKVYSAGRECNVFNPAFARMIYQRLGGSFPRVLDLSAGWGDRAIAAAAAGASVYHGTDPNPNLQMGYSEIVKALKEVSATEVVFADLPGEEYLVRQRFYDICLLSPPYFNLERYIDSAELESNSQSIERYPKYEEWIEKFLKPYYANAYNGLRPGGWLVVYISDIQVQEGGSRNKYPLEHDSWKILRDLGALPGTTFALRVQAPPPPSQAKQAPRRRGARVTEKPAGGKLRPARAWFRPPVVSPLGDAFLTIETNPLEVESHFQPRRKKTCNLARADRLGFGGKSLYPYRKFAGGEKAVYSLATLGDNLDAALACALAKASGSRFCAIIAPGSSCGSAVDRLAAYVTGLGGEVRKAASHDEVRTLQAQTVAPGVTRLEQVVPMAPGIPGYSEDLPVQSKWLAQALLKAFAKTNAGRMPQSVWVYYQSGTTATLLRMGLPKEVGISVGFRDQATHDLFCKMHKNGPAAAGYTVVGFGLGFVDFVDEFYEKSTPLDVVWFEG